MAREAIDSVNLWWLGGATLLVLVAAFELGFAAARKLGQRGEKAMTSMLAAALLALLGLLLAFCFGIVEARFATRKALVIEEANALGTSYRRAALLPSPHAERSRDLLRRYAGVRLRVHSVATLEANAAAAEALQDQLWQQATDVARSDPHSVMAALFVDSVDRTIDTYESRVTVALHHRLPAPMLITLCVIAALSMLVHGYGAGLDRRRTLLPTLTLVVAIGAVLLVIIELDRPWQRMFHVSQSALTNVRAEMGP